MRRLPRRSAALWLALPLSLLACGQSGTNRAQPIRGLATFGDLAADPERQWICAADEATGRLIVVDVRDGSLQHDVATAGAGIGGLHYDPCHRTLCAAVSTRKRLILYDPVTLLQNSVLNLGVAPFALTSGPAGTIVVVTDGGLLHVDTTTLARTELLAEVAADALVTSDRDAVVAFAAETVSGATIVHRFDLLDLGAPPLDNAAAPLPGKVVELAVDHAGSRLYVGTDVAPGIHVLDAATLAPVDTIDVGDGLTGMALNSTGLRLFWTTQHALVESTVLVEPRLDGPSVALQQPSREGGLCLASNNQDIVVWDAAEQLSTHGIHPFAIRAPAVLRQGETGTMTLHGEPDYFFYLLISLEPAANLIDRHAGADPRLIELSLLAGFSVVLVGQFDANGDATYVDTVPTDLPTPMDTVWQAAQTPSLVAPSFGLSNAMVIRFLGPECQ